MRAIGNPDIMPQYGTDLSAFTPPNPVVEADPRPPDFSAGLARAMGEIGQSLLGASKFFSVKTSPGPPNTPSLDLWLDDTTNVPVAMGGLLSRLERVCSAEPHYTTLGSAARTSS